LDERRHCVPTATPEGGLPAGGFDIVTPMLIILMLAWTLQPNIEVGESLTPAAQVAGPWEALVAPGEVTGFSIQITTDGNDKVRALNLDTYVRKEGKTAQTWWSSGADGAFVMRAGQLHFHQVRSANQGFDVTLDFTYDPIDAAWKGSFSDPFFSGHVELRRPSMIDATAPAGTWRTHSEVTIWPTERVEEYGCLDIGVGQDDSLLLWAEDYNVFLGYQKEKEPLFGDSYGEMYVDSHATRHADEWSFIAGNRLAGDRITGVESSDHSSFGGYSSDHYRNGSVDPSHPNGAIAWTRMFDLACRP
jgi:hypothetical protein